MSLIWIASGVFVLQLLKRRCYAYLRQNIVYLIYIIAHMFMFAVTSNVGL